LVFTIPGVSFRLLSAGTVLPRFRHGKQLIGALALVALAGCGGRGGGATPSGQSVSGKGYRFAAPAGWRVTHAAAVTSAGRGDELVSVTVFPLGRPFRPELWQKTVPELDRVASQLAGRLGGHVTSLESGVLAGHRTRSYDIAFTRGGKDLVERIAFLFSGRREYQLLCRFVDDDSACRDFRTSFRLG
jgi:hypothetical protein